MVVKTFVALGFIITIDDRFANTAPAEIWANARMMNSNTVRAKFLKISADSHSYSRIWQEVKKEENNWRLDVYFNGLLNVLINVWVTIMTNVQVIWYNYFAALSIILI